MTALGTSSFDALSAAVAYAGDQCAAIEVVIDVTEGVIQLAPVSGVTGKGEREEHWRAWIKDGIANPTEYFAGVFTNAATFIGVPALTPTAAYPPTPGMVFAPADSRMIGLRVPRDKPFLHFRWSKASPSSTLRLERILPPSPPPGP